ncbi:MAG TPA: carboxypeptidase-like regulatory domain-containing protein, partial [Saprospiraceae bacterium]|nr:carboxypeptidase-like regulatory domain-containing protein [Saprospiraceae bacterium]
MILRNPASLRDSFFTAWPIWLLLVLLPLSSSGQGIRGFVAENFSHHPIPGVQVSIFYHDSLLSVLTTDDLGQYNWSSPYAGRVGMKLEANGFVTLTIEDILLDGYSIVRLDPLLEKQAFELNEVHVVASRPQLNHVRTITPEEMLSVAGNFEDPVRIALSQPGIVLLNDQANHLSARGQSPLLNSWYLEGLEIVNPNHTSNAGTFSDQPTQSGGGINMFSAQVIGNTDIYTGLNPMNVGRNAGAIIDLHLHESAKPELRAKAGLIGFELGGGKQLGENGMLDFNLRYSFTGILTGLGADFGGEKISFYDGVLSYTLKLAKSKLKIFAWGGNSRNDFDRVEPPEDRER